MPKLLLSDRIGAACGAAYIVLILVGNQLSMGGDQDPHPTGSAVLAGFAATPTTTERIGFAMEVLGFVSFMFFLAWLVATLRARGGAWSWLSGVAAVGGVVALAVKVSSFAPVLTGMADHRDLTPGLARVLMDMNGASFVVFTVPYAVFMIGASGAMLATGLVGRVLGWSGLVVGVAGVLVPLPTQLDPVDTNVLPWVLGMLWTLCAGIRLAWKGPRTVAESPAPEPLAVPA
jgi:hypothetical protein